jgi:hypothetical protein
MGFAGYDILVGVLCAYQFRFKKMVFYVDM